MPNARPLPPCEPAERFAHLVGSVVVRSLVFGYAGAPQPNPIAESSGVLPTQSTVFARSHILANEECASLNSASTPELILCCAIGPLRFPARPRSGQPSVSPIEPFSGITKLETPTMRSIGSMPCYALIIVFALLVMPTRAGTLTFTIVDVLAQKRLVSVLRVTSLASTLPGPRTMASCLTSMAPWSLLMCPVRQSPEPAVSALVVTSSASILSVPPAIASCCTKAPSPTSMC